MPRCRASAWPMRRTRSSSTAIPAGRLDAGGAPRARPRFVPEERDGRGAVPEMSLAENALLTAHRQQLVTRRGLIRAARSARVRAGDDREVRRQGRPVPRRRRAACPAATCRNSSSDARSCKRPRVMIAAQPTWGVDVGAVGADPPGADRPARRGRRRARRVRGARRAVRDLRPARRDRAGPAVAGQGRCARPTPRRLGLLMGGSFIAAGAHAERRPSARDGAIARADDVHRRSEARPEPSRLMALGVAAARRRGDARRRLRRCSRCWARIRSRHSTSSSSSRSTTLLRRRRAAAQGVAADAVRARPRRRLPRQRLEHRRRRPADDRRDLRRRRRARAARSRRRAACCR